jgi:hypothetical protein
MGSLVITFYITVLMNQSKKQSEPALNSVIMTQITLLINTVVDFLADITSTTAEKILGFMAQVISKGKTYSLMLVICIILYSFSSETGAFLSGGDTCWRCIVQPLIKNVGFTLLQIGRLIYDAVIPLYNYYYVVTKQATSGTIGIALKCDMSVVIDTIRLILQSFISLFSSIFGWVGVGEMSVENNIMVNELNVTKLFTNIQTIISHQQNISTCVCDGLEDIFDIGFTLAKQKELPFAINHAVNFPLSIIQTFVGILPMFGKFPHFTRTVYHANGFIYNIMKYMDNVFLNAGEKIIGIFDDDFKFQGAPEEFVFTSVGRFIMGGVHIIHTIVRTVLNIIIPIHIKNSDYMMKAMRFDQGIQQMNLGFYNSANNLYWMAKITESFSKELVDVKKGGKFEIVGIPEHVKLNCSERVFTEWSSNVVCGPLLLIETGLNIIYLATNMVGELLWKSAFNQEQNFIRTLQRYDGPSYPRTIDPTCEYRDSIKWDLTAGDCKCIVPKEYGSYNVSKDYPWGVVEYDPYCGQPNFQANVFGNIERAVGFLAGIGLPDKMKDFITIIPSSILEVIRTGIKFILNLVNIVEGKYFHYPVNCAYGVSEEQLERWWLSEGNEISPCERPLVGFMNHTIEVFVPGTSSYRGYRYKLITCAPIHETIRFSKCGTRRNILEKRIGHATTCDKENKAGCMCNVGLPLNDESLCQCIYHFPDRQQEVAQGAFENKVLDKLYHNSNHWCNTYMLEWNFYYLDRFATVVDSFLGAFHPSYDSSADSYCTTRAYELSTTNILHYKASEFDKDKALYDAIDISYSTKSCKIYGSHDFICSTSMTIRAGVRMIIFEVRELIMSLLEMLGGGGGFTVDLGNRLCDLQRTAAGIASTIASIFGGVDLSEDIRKGVAQIIFALIDLPIEALNMLNVFVQFFEEIIAGEINFSPNVLQPVFDLILKELRIVINWIRSVVGGMETFFEGVHRGAGGFFKTIDSIIAIFEQLLTDAAMEMVALFIKVGAGIIDLFTGGGISSTFFPDLWKLLGKAISMLLQNAGKLLDAILDMLGPTGKFIRDVSTTLCHTLQDALCFVTGGDLCDMKCADGAGATSFSPAEVVADVGAAVDDFFGLFGHRLHSSMHQLPLKVATEMNWEGSSNCDSFVNAYRNYNWTDLRPNEKITLVECLEDRMLAVNMAKHTGVDVPVDLVYNWKRKWILMKDFIISGQIYFGYMMGDYSSREIRPEMLRRHVNPDFFIPIWSKTMLSIKRFTSITNINDAIHSTFKAFDPNIKTSNSTMGNVYRLYDHTSKAASKVMKTTTKIDVQLGLTTRILRKNHFIPSNISRQLIHGYHLWSNVKLRTGLTQSISKKNARRLILNAAGINSDVTPCNERSDSHVCLNCLALDNLLNIVINEGDRMRKYYEYTFFPIILPSFVKYFEDKESESKAWREDMGEMMEKAAKAAAGNAEDWTNEQFDAIQKGYKLQKSFKIINTTISSWKRARKDWEYLFSNFKLRNDDTLLSVFESFFTVTDDAYVPLFGQSATWFISYPFVGTCSMETIYCTTYTTAERLNHIDDSLWYNLYFTLSIFFIQWYTGIPVFSLISPYFITIWGFVFMLTTYDWKFTCAPNIPNCLSDDLFSYLNDRIFPTCWCTYFPGLAQSCDPETCFLCSLNTGFDTCESQVPLVASMGIFWAPMFYIRSNYPTYLVWAYKNIPFSWILRRYHSVVEMSQSIIENVEITKKEQDCLQLRFGDIYLFIIILYVSFEISSLIIPIAIRVTQHTIKLITLSVAILYTMVISIELQSTSGLKNTFQHDGL